QRRPGGVRREDRVHARIFGTNASARPAPIPDTQAIGNLSYTLEGEIPATRMQELQQQLRSMTHGEGVLEFAFDHYKPVSGTAPTRPCAGQNPLNRKEYLGCVIR
ncbi:MAG TPA: GTP-binding protein, partial [Dehalococcoidia bacterium]|nr:GTP-binding protein [Dehalococcoidia bacterium]